MPSYASAPASDYATSISPLHGVVQDDGKPIGVSGWRARNLAAQDFVQRNVGLLLIVAAQGFFALMNVAVKKLHGIDPPVSTFQLILVRMAITYICSVAYMIFAGVPHPFIGPKGVRLLLVLRGSTGFFGLLGIYYSLQYLSLSDATVLTFLAPLTTGIAGAVLLGEIFTKKQAFASIVSLVGVLLIARPSFLFRPAIPNMSEAGTPEQRLIAVGVSLFGVCGMTGAYVSIRALGKRVHPLHAMVAFSTQCIIGSSLGMLIQGTPFVIPSQWVWLGCLLMIGTFGFFAQLLLTMGLQREKVGRGTMAVYTQVVFAIGFELAFFGTFPSILSGIGATIILTAALYVALAKQSEKPQRLGQAEERLEEGQIQTGDNGDEVGIPSQKAHETTALLRPNGSTNRYYA